jgi:hypothetical protein
MDETRSGIKQVLLKLVRQTLRKKLINPNIEYKRAMEIT